MGGHTPCLAGGDRSGTVFQYLLLLPAIARLRSPLSIKRRTACRQSSADRRALASASGCHQERNFSGNPHRPFRHPANAAWQYCRHEDSNCLLIAATPHTLPWPFFAPPRKSHSYRPPVFRRNQLPCRLSRASGLSKSPSPEWPASSRHCRTDESGSCFTCSIWAHFRKCAGVNRAPRDISRDK